MDTRGKNYEHTSRRKKKTVGIWETVRRHGLSTSHVFTGQVTSGDCNTLHF